VRILEGSLVSLVGLDRAGGDVGEGVAVGHSREVDGGRAVKTGGSSEGHHSIGRTRMRRTAALCGMKKTGGPSKVADGRDVAGGAADQFDRRCSCENGQRGRGRIKRIDSINASASKPRLAGLAAIRLRTKWRDLGRR